MYALSVFDCMQVQQSCDFGIYKVLILKKLIKTL